MCSSWSVMNDCVNPLTLLILIDDIDLSGLATYCKTSSISQTKSQNLNASCILLQFSLLSPLKPGVKLRMKM